MLNHMNRTLTDWVMGLNNRHQATYRNNSRAEMYIKLAQAGGNIAYNIRGNRYHRILDGLSACAVALFDFHNRLTLDEEHGYLFADSNGFPGLEAYTFYRFPRRCFHCGGHRCECFIVFQDNDNRTDPERAQIEQQRQQRLAEARDRETPPATLDKFGVMFHEIYGQGHHFMSITDIGFHLMEEIGEIGEALVFLKDGHYDEKKKRFLEPHELRDLLCDEMADVISWIFALLHKTHKLIKNAQESKERQDHLVLPTLSELLERDYPW